MDSRLSHTLALLGGVLITSLAYETSRAVTEAGVALGMIEAEDSAAVATQGVDRTPKLEAPTSRSKEDQLRAREALGLIPSATPVPTETVVASKGAPVREARQASRPPVTGDGDPKALKSALDAEKLKARKEARSEFRADLSADERRALKEQRDERLSEMSPAERAAVEQRRARRKALEDGE